MERWFDTDAFRLAEGQYGDAGRSIIDEPGRTSLDFSIFKNFDVAEGHRIQLRWEMYNATNTPPFLTPRLGYNTVAPVDANNPDGAKRCVGSFGQITSALEGREMQMGLRWQF